MKDDLTRQLAQLLNQSWSIQVSQDEENGWVARCVEMPDAIAAADQPTELEAELWGAIRASIEARLRSNLPIPVPKRRMSTVIHEFTPLPMLPPDARGTVATSSTARVYVA